MKVSFTSPRRELQPYIDSFWVFETSNGVLSNDDSVAAPNGCAKLIYLYENALIVTADVKNESDQPPG